MFSIHNDDLHSPPRLHMSGMSQHQTGRDKVAVAHIEQGIASSRKRQKISLACEECHTRKVRCDGLRPQCSACNRRARSKQPCTYLSEPSRISGNKRTIQSLHDRLAYLEDKLSREKEPNISSGNAEFISEGLETLQCDSDSTVHDPRQSLPHLNVITPARSSSDDIARDIDGRASGQDFSVINAMGIAPLTTDAMADTSSEFYGQPSAASLLCDIRDHGHRPPRFQPSRRSISTHYSSNKDDYHLPPRYVADGLLDLYHKRVQSIYPFLHWPSFKDAYNRLWLSDTDVKSMPQLTGVGLGGPNCSVPVFYSALNAIFALASQFTHVPAQERKERYAPFIRRSRHLMRLEFLDDADLSMVQALLILARYLQNTSLPTRCWNVAGVAYRMAQGLGLHLEINEGTISPLEKEMRRRVWHSCACLDTVLGMLTGRPCSNSNMSKVPLPSAPDEDISASVSVGNEDNDADVCTTNFFAEAVKLSHILNRILGQIYDPWKEHEASNRTKAADEKYYAQQVSSIIELDHDLNSFEAGVPEALHWSTETPTLHSCSALPHQRHALRTRILHIRVLLYRPLFVQRCRKVNAQAKTPSEEKSRDTPRSQNQLHGAFAEICSIACIETAQALIDHVNNGSETAYGGPPWYSCYYIYHAAMVVILADISSQSLQQLNHGSLSESWRTCEDFFRRTSEHNPEIYQYFRGLESISRFVQPAYPRTIDNSMKANAPICEEHQELIIDHITNSYLDPTMVPGLEAAQGGGLTQFSDIEFELGLGDDQVWTLAGLSAMNVSSMVI
ncbi:fungal-specific transcription factor domain-containing protein [Leptodontidium sp. MPI-SDFR-AT-0119]|nr:fungal-specific transcription factor domain-containing protein [Leptodontidium sp. MPI-SDFR-AT-0119]